MADLVIPQGKTWRVAFPIVGTFNPEGWGVRSQVRARVSSDEVLHEWNAVEGTAGFETIPAAQLTAAGHPTDVDQLAVVLHVAPSVSAAWEWRQGYYDIEVSNGTDVLLVASGQVTVSPEITR